MLTLRLRRVEKINPSKILFSLPSICDRLPAGDGVLSAGDCILAEDDWRQFELVSRQFAAESDAEIEAIRRIHELETAEVGWRKIHVRRRPDPPIIGPLMRKDVDRAFSGAITFRGVRFEGTGSSIVSGYPLKAADGLQCYGIEDGDQVKVLGIVQSAPAPPPIRSADALAEIARAFDSTWYTGVAVAERRRTSHYFVNCCWAQTPIRLYNCPSNSSFVVFGLAAG